MPAFPNLAMPAQPCEFIRQPLALPAAFSILVNKFMKRPNILLLYTDQQRWDALRCSGNPLIHTPNLDALAARGALFRKAFVNCPLCMPSRMSMLSGRYPLSLNIRANGVEMPEDIPCLQHILGLYGYHTANFGKLHFKNHSNRDHRVPHPAYGFDTLVLSDEPGCYDDAYIKWVETQAPGQVENCRCDTPPEWRGKPIQKQPRSTEDYHVFQGSEHLTHSAFVADETIAFLKTRRPGEPFFCIAGFYAPHSPTNPPRRFVDMYDPAKMPLPKRREGQNLRDISDDHWRQTVAHYYALVSHVDDQAGRILRTLDEQGLADDTIVVFTSDHGEYLGDHGRVGKSGPQDSSARVPLLIAWPGHLAAGRQFDQIVEAVDLAPTLLDACAVQIPPFMQGMSLRPLLEGREFQARDSAYIECHVRGGTNGYKAVRTRDYLYSCEKRGYETLFDLKKNPDQTENVKDDPAYAAVKADLRHQLIRRSFEAEANWPPRPANY